MRGIECQPCLVVICLLYWAWTSHAVAEPPEAPRNRVGSGIQRILEVTPGSEGLDVELKDVAEAYKAKNIDRVEDALEKLATRLIKGTDPDKPYVDTVANASIRTFGGYINEPDPLYAASIARHKLMVTLMGRATALGATDPAAGARYGRAALLLAGVDGFSAGHSFLTWALANKAQVSKAAQLSEEQVEKLRELLELTDAERSAGSDLAIADYARDEIWKLKAGQPVPPKLLNASLYYYSAAIRALRDRPDYQLRLAQDLWILKNIVRKVGDVEAVAQVEGAIKSWESSEQTTPHVKRWLSQALTQTAPPPDYPTLMGFEKYPQRLKQFAEAVERAPRYEPIQ